MALAWIRHIAEDSVRKISEWTNKSYRDPVGNSESPPSSETEDKPVGRSLNLPVVPHPDHFPNPIEAS